MSADDIDEIAVERACKGDLTVTLNRAEAADAFRRLDARGLSAQEIADRLGTTQRTVVRWRTGEGSPISRPGTTASTTKDKVAAALKSRHAPVRRAAARANQALATLDTVLAEWDAKEQALERVAELERALADAKAALRRPSSAKPKQAASGEHAQARAWATDNGIAVPPKGRVPESVLDQWKQATA